MGEPEAVDYGYYKEIGEGLHEFIRPLVVDVLIREVGPVLEDSVARRIAREEIASLCGLVLRRLQDETFAQATEASTDDALAALRSIFGEALRDFGSDTEEPGK